MVHCVVESLSANMRNTNQHSAYLLVLTGRRRPPPRGKGRGGGAKIIALPRPCPVPCPVLSLRPPPIGRALVACAAKCSRSRSLPERLPGVAGRERSLPKGALWVPAPAARPAHRRGGAQPIPLPRQKRGPFDRDGCSYFFRENEKSVVVSTCISVGAEAGRRALLPLPREQILLVSPPNSCIISTVRCGWSATVFGRVSRARRSCAQAFSLRASRPNEGHRHAPRRDAPQYLPV